ncbi:AfsR/SARP family transcriptional regulator [Catellatospora chokoriensis]|uniref:Bacterial transcriptional activator domain-containing protein n=1 Tax=Catellatospora chokoriensis TaxID=310353 RepID=A0A8J3K6K4_9ACTN|nr:BTAD domain-containing putative transcriptional regulator [Catellatospora chokoriensis]GIF90394.1 hypothetical protein Cch02nite_38380 [Catellatospora chokoriensis]
MPRSVSTVETDVGGQGEGSGARPDFRLRLFEGFHMEHHGCPVTQQPAAGRLIAFLCIRGRRSRAEIVGTLWPETLEDKAQARLRTLLWRLHRIAPGLLSGRDTLAIGPAVDTDVANFQTLAWRLVEGGHRRAADRPDAAALPSPSCVLVGELLPGWYDDWVIFERERLRQLQLHALEALAVRLTAQRRHGEAVEAGLAAVRMDPLRESATRVLIEAFLAESNVAEAMRHFQAFRLQLADELGLTPTADLERLVYRSSS